MQRDLALASFLAATKIPATAFLTGDCVHNLKPSDCVGHKWYLPLPRRCKHESLVLQSTSREPEETKEEYDEITKYRNRAAVAEDLLKMKMENMKAMQGKLVVLQDVVSKLKAKTEAKAKDSEDSEWKEQFLTEQLVRQKAENDLRELTDEFRKERLELEAKNKEYQTELQALQKAYDSDRSRWKKELQKQKTQNKELQVRVKALQEELLEMDSSFEATQQDLIEVQKQLDKKDLLAREALRKEIARAEKLEHDLEVVTKERDEALAKVKANGTTTATDESVEIAKAAVAAAEKRQEEAEKQLQHLKADYENLDGEKKALNELLTVAEEEKSALEDALEEALNKTAVEDDLRLEIKKLEDELENVRSELAGQQKKENSDAYQELTRMQEDYEQQILNLQTLLLAESQSPYRKIWNNIRNRFSRKSKK